MKVIFKYGEELKKNGHDVKFYRRLLPYNYYRGNSTLPQIITLYITKVYSYLFARRSESDFYIYSFKIKSVPLINSLFVRRAEVVIATEWVTAFSVYYLPKAWGKKYYFIQSYEIWGGNPDLVDKSYRLPLNQIVISSYLKKYLKGKFSTDAEVVVNGIDLNDFECSSYNPQKKEITIMFIFSKQELKNTQLALDVCKKVYKYYPDVRIVAFGYHEAELPSFIKYYHSPDKNMIKNIYKECDIFLFTSFVEGFGLPPAEAMLSGCAVITSPVGAVPEYSVHMESAILVEELTVEKYLYWIEYLLDHRTEITRLGQNASKVIPTRLNWKDSVQKMEKILLEH